MRCQTPVPNTPEDKGFLPTNAHQLTPCASPVGQRRCVELDVSASFPSLESFYDRENNNSMHTTASPTRCYMPRRVSNNFHVAAASFSSLLDGDATPPLHDSPSFPVISPSTLPLELTDERRYQGSSCAKRKRIAEAREDAAPSTKMARTAASSSGPATQALLLATPLELPLLSRRISRSPSQKELSLLVVEDNIPLLPEVSLPTTASKS